MRKSFNYYRQVEDPDIYLCNPDYSILGYIHGTERNFTWRFNDLSEFSMIVPKPMNDVHQGEALETLYDKVQGKRLVFVDNIGWFQIDSAQESDDGSYTYKTVTCKSHQCVLNNKGVVCENRVYMFYNPLDPKDELYDSNNIEAIPSIVGLLVKNLGIKLNLQTTEISRDEGYDQWTLEWITPSLYFRAKSKDAIYESATSSNICRTMKDDKYFGYDFMKNEVSEAFEVVFEFDFLRHAISVRRIDEITASTNIYLSFDNVVNQLDVSEDSDNIVTVLSCEGNGVDITTANPMGTNYIVNFDYYMQEIDGKDGKKEYPWMSQALIQAIIEWKKIYAENQEDYSNKAKELQAEYQKQTECAQKIQAANIKLRDLQRIIDDENTREGIVTAETVEGDFVSLKTGEAFSDEKTITAYKQAPIMFKSDEGLPVFKFQTAEGVAFTDFKTAKIKSLALDYTPDKQDDDTPNNATIYSYFIDEDKNSYCKLTVSSAVGVSRDSYDTPSSVKPGQDSFVTVGDITFTVKLNDTSVNVYAPESTTPLTLTNNMFDYQSERYSVMLTADNYVNIYKYYISGYERYTSTQAIGGEQGWYSLWMARITSINTDNDSLQAEIDRIKGELKEIADVCNIEKFIQSTDDKLYQELGHYWIEGEFSNDNIEVSETATMDTIVDLANDLMESAVEELKRASQPTYTVSVDAINFTDLIEFRQFTDELELGRLITIEKQNGVYFKLAFVSMETSLDDPASFSLEFSNAQRPTEAMMTYADLVKQSSSTSRTVSANWSNLTDYSRHKEDIDNLLYNPLDSALRTTNPTLSNQEFTVDTTGILGRRYSDDSHTLFEPQQLRITNNQILFTDDAWESTKLALGKISYTDQNGASQTAYGLAADVLIGNLILGRGMYLSNATNNIRLDENGISISKILTDELGDPQIDENGNVAMQTVFKADTNGNLEVRGKIIATDLELMPDVTIDYNSIAGTPNMAEYAKETDLTKYVLKTAIESTIPVQETPTVAGMIALRNGRLYTTTSVKGTATNALSSKTYNFDMVPILQFTRLVYRGESTPNITSVDLDQAIFKVKTGSVDSGAYTFTYKGGEWTKDDAAIDIKEYGFKEIITTSETPTEGDYITITISSEPFTVYTRTRQTTEGREEWDIEVGAGTIEQIAKNIIDNIPRF